jgi:hypothetical protein
MAYEQTESSTSTPTNSGSVIRWVGVASDTGNAPYFLIVCSNSATPTANAAPSIPTQGTVPPTCVGGTRWGVSTGTTQNTQAIVSTTTSESAPFGELNDWYAWICDDDPVNPRCNNTYSQGTSATNSSPFHVNFRPTFTNVYSDSPENPGGVINYFSTSTDPDSVAGEDNIVLHICYLNDFTSSATSSGCGAGGTVASTTVAATVNATSSFTLSSVIRDAAYDAFAFIVDQHHHQASGGVQGENEGFIVNNVAPTVVSGDIVINGGAALTLSVDGGQTTGYTLAFELSDANSCINASSTTELPSYLVALHRSAIGTTTCNGLGAAYNPNNCYVGDVATTTWNLSCTASTTSCGGSSDPTRYFNCTFPLWFVADPTDSSSPYDAQNWLLAIAGVDDDNATGTLTIGSSGVELISFPAIDLLTSQIPYGQLEPGDDSGTLTATSTITSVGNTGLNQNVAGEHMCPTYSPSTECATIATSTIPDDQQEFATSSISYGTGTDLSSSTNKLVLLRVPKTTSTTNFNTGVTYWGIAVPIAITVAGSYTGLNTFSAVVSSSTDW